jgi:hypothetical protein
MKLTMTPLVNWEMGNILIGGFVVVCVIIIAVIYNMVQSGKEKSEENQEGKQN